jgi:hypothetical protein
MAIDLQQFTIEKLIEAGHIDAASKLARQAAKSSGPSRIEEYEASVRGTAAAGPALTPEQVWKAADESGENLKLSYLRTLTVDQFGDLKQAHKELLERSMKFLKKGE